jgi:fructokinase
MVLLGAIECGGTKFNCAIGSGDGEIYECISIPTSRPEETLRGVIDFFAGKGVHAIGVGTFGPIDLNPQSQSYGSVIETPKPFWSGFNIVDHIKGHFDVPIGFDTDVNAAALGEATWGAASGLDSCLYMTVGTGIGAGAVVEGKLIHGLTHSEMGHILVRRHPDDGYVGNCPFHRDCLEGLASGPAIEARWGRKAVELEAAHPAWELEAYYLAQALVTYQLVLSPKKIILGGGVMKQSHLFPMIRQNVRSLLNGYVQHPSIIEEIDCFIVPPKLNDHAGLSGALALASRALKKNK